MRTVLRRCGLAAATALGLSVLTAQAASIPQNLGFGLDKLVESRQIVQQDAHRAIYNGYATEEAANYAAIAIMDAASDRVLVDIVPRGKQSVAALQSTLEANFASLSVLAVDANYRGTGVIEAYVSVDDAAALAEADGVRSVFLALKPYTRSTQQAVPQPSAVPGDHLNKVGTAFDQGVTQHRVDRISQVYNPLAPVNYDGTGISIGILSDSYDTRAAAPHAATGVTNFDLPGAPNNPWNTTPVTVLEDYPGGTDEGRGMTEIVYKMAPKARLAFATADTGEVGFANNIRALAALPGFAKPDATQQGFKADVIADDVGYYDEPWYQDGVIANGIDDVAAAGVSYFSSAANDVGINGYESPLRLVANGTGTTSATNSALAGTNINLAGVPANLYAGGFHNFNPSGLDVAQLVNLTSTQVVVMQWDDPYDTRDLTPDQPPIFSATGTISTANPSATFDGSSTPALPPFVGGQAYVITEAATSGNFDAIINIYDSAGNLILNQDTGTDETVNFYPPTTDQYRIVVNRYSTTTGDFTITVNTADGNAGVTTDLNLLVFNTAGAYQSTRSLTSNNVATNRPIELGQFNSPSGGQVQFVIARGNTPSGTNLPTRVRWLIPGNGASGIGPAEYFSYNTVTTGGHPTANGCNGTAAYSVFRPNVPESFTSPGPATIMFDKDSKRLGAPEIREQPRIAAADAANTSFFTSDTTADYDSNPNFSGTSAAAPHAAAIAALVLQSRGGPGSVSPSQMTEILKASAFPHDLDPSAASGTAVTTDGGTVTITINADNDTNLLTGQNDLSSFQISYAGPGSIASFTFNPAGTATAGGNVTGGSNGVQDDAGSLPATVSYFENNFPGLAFLPATKAFTLGPLTNLVAADITAPQSTSPYTGFSNLAPAPANGTSQFRTMTIGFPTGNFTAGAVARFTVGRGAQHSAAVGTTAVPVNGTVTNNPLADLFGGGVSIPSGVITENGMTFSGTTTSGGVFTGVIKNKIGKGYSVVDGYGFIDASVATGTLAGSANVTPGSANRGDSVLFTVNVTPASAPASTGLSVTANLTGIGGNAGQTFYDDGTHGDVTAGDNVFSFATTVGNNAPAGTKVIPIAIADSQARTGNTSVNFTVLAPTSPTGIAAATPGTVSITEGTLLTVQVTPGTGPASTGITVNGDLSGIGGDNNQAFFDDGSHGDAVANDGTYSFFASVSDDTSPGAKSLLVRIADAQSRSSTANIALTVNASSAPTATASASPNAGPVGTETLLTVAVTDGSNPTSTGITVTADLSGIGGGASQTFYDDGTHGDVTAGDGTYSFAATVDASATSGPKVLPVSVHDDQNRSASASIAFNVAAATGLSGTGLATPESVAQGETVSLIVAINPGTNPTSTDVTVTADLSVIGGSASQSFYDDGTHGDQVAGDGIYTYAASIPVDVVDGTFTLPVAIEDAQSRTATTNIAVTVSANDVIFANSFE